MALMDELLSNDKFRALNSADRAEVAATVFSERMKENADFQGLSNEDRVDVINQFFDHEIFTGGMPKKPTALDMKRADLNLLGNIFERPAGAIRASLRSISDPSETFEEAAVRGFNDPISIESFQDEFLRRANDVMDKTFVANLPQGPQTAVRTAAGIDSPLRRT